MQRDEIQRTNDPYLRCMLKSLYEEITVECPTADGVLGESRLGAFLLSDGTELNIALHGSSTRRDAKAIGVSRLRDSMIARTASNTSSLLVHNDHRYMIKIAERLNQPHMVWDDFRSQMLVA